jgi:hypothetical protein
MVDRREMSVRVSTVRATHGGETEMLIDCDTCTVRGTGCADCVVTVLLGAPPGWQGSDPVVLPMPVRPSRGASAEDAVQAPSGVVVEFDEVERRAVRALAECGLVPPLRHQEGHQEGHQGTGT